MRIPNADTQEALRLAATGDDLIEYDGLDDLKAKFDGGLAASDLVEKVGVSSGSDQ